MRFVKMHGCGNDYVYLDGWEQADPADPAALSRAVSDRHRGIGSDGLIIIGPDPAGADARMRMWNADGSESEMCGNGIRCAAALARNRGHVPGNTLRIATGAGLKDCTCLPDADGQVRRVRVDMGRPLLTPAQVPVLLAASGPRLDLELTLADGQRLPLIAVGMGNPHAVCFVADATTTPVASWGPQIEHHPLFPKRTNIEFVEEAADGSLRQRTWERGSGETQACGTGACATAVAAILTCRRPPGWIRVQLLGGSLDITWNGDPASTVLMEGEAIAVYSGDWPA